MPEPSVNKEDRNASEGTIALATPAEAESKGASLRSRLWRIAEIALYFLLGPAIGSALAGLLSLLAEVSADRMTQSGQLDDLAMSVGVVSCLLTWFALVIAIIKKSIPVVRVLAEIFVIVVLPVWGLLINLMLPDCQSCGETNRPLVVPDIYSLYGLYAAAALGYLVARRRPERLRPLAEALVSGLLIAGLVICLLLAIHFRQVALFGLVFAPIGLPLTAPWVVGCLFTAALIRRLRRRGVEVGPAGPGARAAYSSGMAVVTLGLWSVIHRLLLDQGPLSTFTEACGRDWTFATRMPPPQDCHYLCTVAARGHPWLVRPQRLGHRRGHPILVNRQLALANAFEDLLRERWPRFGRLCRLLYDRLAWPLSRQITHPLASDAIYLLMKPAEWLFALTLLILDPEEPEERIGRMYRD